MRTNFYLIILFLSCLLGIFENKQARAQINIYADTQAGMYSMAVRNALFRVYVPNGDDGTVSVIDPITYTVINTFYTGKDPQHVVPSYDLQTLWVLNNKSNSVTPIEPETSKPGANIQVDDPYNLYFTPDGKFAIVVCEARKELQFRNPKTMKLFSKLPINCSGANHMEFTTDGHYAVVTCEYSGQLMKVDLNNFRVVNYLDLSANDPKQDPKKIITVVNTSKKVFLPEMKKNLISDFNVTNDGNFFVVENDQQKIISQNMNIQMIKMESMPQDIRSSQDGRIFFVADMLKDGVILIDPVSFTKIGFIPTGIGTHAIYPSRDGKLFYVSNRGCHRLICGPHGPGSISVIDPTKQKVIATWIIPQGGSPDMGNVTGDGKELWLSGRYDNEVYVFDTEKGILTHRIRVGKGPHGLAVWPQPGRYSLGHTGNMR